MRGSIRGMKNNSSQLTMAMAGTSKTPMGLGIQSFGFPWMFQCVGTTAGSLGQRIAMATKGMARFTASNHFGLAGFAVFILFFAFDEFQYPTDRLVEDGGFERVPDELALLLR